MDTEKMMFYREKFDEISAHGLPIRDPQKVVVWAREALFDAFAAFGAEWRGTVAGCTRSDFISEVKFREYVTKGLLTPQINTDKCKKLWALFGLPTPIPSFTGSLADHERIMSFDGEEGFAGDLASLYKKKMRLSGLCGGWLDTYRGGRLYYGSLYPYGCTTGRCAPRPSDGFLPAMGHEVTEALLNPPEGRCITIFDFRSQGVSILAALSHDPSFEALARAKKDPYLGLGKILGLVPEADYASLSVGELKEKFKAQRELCKRLLLAYQYGAGSKRLGSVSGLDGDKIKHGLDTLFKGFVEWRKGLSPECHLPDGFVSTAKIACIAHVQGVDAWILRRIVAELSLPEGAFIIATNHDCVWVEHNSGFDPIPTARFMESIADSVCGSEGLFRVTFETIPHT